MNLAEKLSRLYGLLSVQEIGNETYEMAKEIEREILGRGDLTDIQENERRIKAENKLFGFYKTNLSVFETEVSCILSTNIVIVDNRERALEQRNKRIEIYRKLIHNFGQY